MSRCFDFWLCEGRVCTGENSEKLRAPLQKRLEEECKKFAYDERFSASQIEFRLLRGGCFGLCNAAPNLVVRRYGFENTLPNVEQDKLSLTHLENEWVYEKVNEEKLTEIVRAHFFLDEPVKTLLYRKKNRLSVAARILQVRSQEKAAKSES